MTLCKILQWYVVWFFLGKGKSTSQAAPKALIDLEKKKKTANRYQTNVKLIIAILKNAILIDVGIWKNVIASFFHMIFHNQWSHTGMISNTFHHLHSKNFWIKLLRTKKHGHDSIHRKYHPHDITHHASSLWSYSRSLSCHP